MKIENLHIDARRKIHWIQNAILFDSIYDENNEVITENRFRAVASPGACERLATLVVNTSFYSYYCDIRQGCYVFGFVCLTVCLSVHRALSMNFDEIIF